MSSKSPRTLKAGPKGSDVLSQKVQSLSELNHLINQIKHHLQKLCERRDLLEKEIISIRAVNAPIKRLPPELLSEIFQVVVTPQHSFVKAFEESRREAANLFLVCKLWHDLLVNSTFVWRYIAIRYTELQSVKSQMEWIQKQHRYLDLFLARSKGAPLIVSMNLRAMASTRTMAVSRTREVLDGLADADDMEEWLDDIDWEECPLEEVYEEMNVGLIRAAIGGSGEHLARWGSLCLQLPLNPKMELYIWKLFQNKPAPTLEELLIHGYTEESVENLGQLFTGVPSLPALQELNLLSPQYLKNIPECPSIRRLELWVGPECYSPGILSQVSKFPTIEELRIDGGLGSAELVSPTIDPIFIPSLALVDLSGPFPHTFIQAIGVGRLNKLKIWEQRATIDSIPIADVYSVAEYVEYDYSRESEDPIASVLLRLFSQLTNAHTIELCNTIQTEALDTIKACQAQNKLQRLRRLICFRRTAGENEEFMTFNFPDCSDSTLLLSKH